MDNCFVDVVTEFLGVCIHSILYYTAVYPENVFETKRKYGVVVYQTIHPEVNEYINLCLKSINETLKLSQLNRVEVAITNITYEPLIKFVFEINRNTCYNDSLDPYLVRAEENLRAFCLSLASTRSKFDDLPEDRSFTIYLHTNESAAVSLSNNPQLGSFPLVEVNNIIGELEKIFPLRRFPVKNYDIDTFMEMNLLKTIET